MTEPTPAKTLSRDARLKTVPIPQMKVSPVSQRELRQSRVNWLVANLDLEELGAPTVSYRDGHYWILDGQHRIEALRAFGLGDEKLQCWTYEGLTEEEEAEKFLQLNNVLSVGTFDKFKVGLKAGRQAEVEIDQIVRVNGLRISRDNVPGAISAVATLRKIHGRAGVVTLGRTLRIIRDAYGDFGLQATVLDGIGHVCQRYNGDLDDGYLIERLTHAKGGVTGLLGKAEQIRLATGNPKAQCVAAAAIQIHNAGRGSGKKLPAWWKDRHS